jgi:hypothetical protein
MTPHDRIIGLPEEFASTAPADGAQAFAEPVVFELHFDIVEGSGLCIVDGLRFAFCGECLFLTDVTRLAIDPGVDEPALLHGSRQGRGADHGGKQNRSKKLHGQPMWIGNRARSTSSFEERQEILDHEIAGQVHDTEPTIISAKMSRTHSGADSRGCIVGPSSHRHPSVKSEAGQERLQGSRGI